MRTKLLVFLLLVILAVQVIFSSKQKCAYYDEPFQISAGLYHLKYNDYRIEVQNPPLLRIFSALPLLFTDVTVKKEEKKEWISYEKYAFGKEFLYKNILSADTILFLARLQILALSIFLGIIVFLWSVTIFNDAKTGLLALSFYCFSPNILAFSGIAGTDLGVTFFIVLSLFLFRHYFYMPSPRKHCSHRLTQIKHQDTDKHRYLIRVHHLFYLCSSVVNFILSYRSKNVILTGISVGLAFSSKFTAVLLIPIFVFLVVIKKNRIKNLANIILIFIIASFVVAVVYQGSITQFIDGLKNVFGIVGEKGALTFLHGKYSAVGFRNYYLVAFLIKSTIPVVVLIVISILLYKKIPADNFDKMFLLVPAVVFFVAASYSKTQIGLRYILPVYPLFFIYFSGLIKIKNNFLLLASCFLLLFHIYSSVKTYPHYLAYFNEFIGGSKNGYKYLVDSNLDWGQDLKLLKKYLDGKNVNLIECYFGQGDTKYEGIKSQHILTSVCSDNVDYTKKDRRDLLAISATYFQGIYIGDIHVFDWLKGGGGRWAKDPIANIGYSMLVYDITDDAESHQKLGDIFLYGVKNQKAAEKEYKHAAEIQKKTQLKNGYK
ncbi:MAG: hypothetical protein AB1349_05070 [Elusimicrobiota bacterium]